MSIMKKLTYLLGNSATSILGNGTVGALTKTPLRGLGLAATRIAVAKSAVKATSTPNPFVKVVYGLSCA